MREDDLAWLDRFLWEPGVVGPLQGHGWWDLGRWRRRWADNGLLGEDDGPLLAVRGADRLGFVAWSRVVTSNGSSCWRIGIALLPEARGHGYGTRAQELLVRYLFAHTQMVRGEAVTEVANAAERRSLEKAGFTQEGVLRSYAFRDGRWRDAVLYGVVRDDTSA
ncbi:MAG TPA: GNAT family protein [Thermomonospora sp.]|nr:GNAT family protein [Thermomonospora sp.]